MDNTYSDNPKLEQRAERERLPHVAVLLCTYHGEMYLREQLESLMNQDYPSFSVWASDDSRDRKTRKILEDFQFARPDVSVRIYSGPGQGSSANFLGLLMFGRIKAEYFAFCDQDDVWKPNKLSQSIKALEALPKDQPALYCSRVELIDGQGESVGYSPIFNKAPSFSNALVQSLAGGNTMVLNRRARDIVAGSGVTHVVVHDWWVYLLVTGVGGAVIYDRKPTLFYRQHQNNEIGCDQSLLARLKRLGWLLRRQHQEWHAVNVKALRDCEDLLTPENRSLLEKFEACRRGSIVYRLSSILSFPFVRQTAWGTLSLYLALILKRL